MCLDTPITLIVLDSTILGMAQISKWVISVVYRLKKLVPTWNLSNLFLRASISSKICWDLLNRQITLDFFLQFCEKDILFRPQTQYRDKDLINCYSKLNLIDFTPVFSFYPLRSMKIHQNCADCRDFLIFLCDLSVFFYMKDNR